MLHCKNSLHKDVCKSILIQMELYKKTWRCQEKYLFSTSFLRGPFGFLLLLTSFTVAVVFFLVLYLTSRWFCLSSHRQRDKARFWSRGQCRPNPFSFLKGHSPLYPLLSNRELNYCHESNKTLLAKKTLRPITKLANKSHTTDRTIK